MSPGDGSIWAHWYLGGGPSVEIWGAGVSVSCYDLAWMPFALSIVSSFSQSPLPPARRTATAWQQTGGLSGERLHPGWCLLVANRRKMQNRVMGPGSGVRGLMLKAVVSRILWAGYLTRQMCSCGCSLSFCCVLHQVFPIWSRSRPTAAARLLK